MYIYVYGNSRLRLARGSYSLWRLSIYNLQPLSNMGSILSWFFAMPTLFFADITVGLDLPWCHLSCTPKGGVGGLDLLYGVTFLVRPGEGRWMWGLDLPWRHSALYHIIYRTDRQGTTFSRLSPTQQTSTFSGETCWSGFIANKMFDCRSRRARRQPQHI